ncbi:MAG: hypothetical protein ACYC6U_11195 [Bellilinea sp.]
MTLEQISILSWVRLAAGLILFAGPGFLLLSFSPFRKKFDFSAKLIVSFGYSAALWAIFLSVTSLLGIRIPAIPTVVLFAICWGVGIWKSKGGRIPVKSLKITRATTYTLLLWGFLILALISRLWIVRQEVAGLGSDSYHHTLFTQMIMDQGMLPQNYGADSPVITFTYHFGFHASAAFLGWVSAIPARLLLLVYGYILVILCSAAVGMAAEKMIGTKIAGFTATILTASFFVFPAFMLLWGRYTQLTGLTLMTIFLAVFWLWIKDGFTKAGILELGVLAAGIGLTHYRIVTLTAIAAIVMTLVSIPGNEFKQVWKKAIIRGMLLIWVAAAGLAPWLFHIWKVYQTGYPVITAPPAETYFSLQRLGQEILNYPLNLVGLILLGASLLAGWLMRSRIVMAMTLWSVISLIPSRYLMLLDTVSVVISLFVPAAIVIAWGLQAIVNSLDKIILPKAVKLGLAPLLLFLLAMNGIRTTLAYPVTLDGYLRPLDLKAFAYITEQLPADAKFMVNLYRFPFSDILMVGSDGGYWIPLLTNRQTVVPPMTFTNERVASPDYADKLRQMEQLNDQLTSDEGLELLAKENIGYIYIGERGGQIDPAPLFASPHFRLVYDDRPVLIFKFMKQTDKEIPRQ